MKEDELTDLVQFSGGFVMNLQASLDFLIGLCDGTPSKPFKIESQNL